MLKKFVKMRRVLYCLALDNFDLTRKITGNLNLPAPEKSFSIPKVAPFGTLGPSRSCSGFRRFRFKRRSWSSGVAISPSSISWSSSAGALKESWAGVSISSSMSSIFHDKNSDFATLTDSVYYFVEKPRLFYRLLIFGQNICQKRQFNKHNNFTLMVALYKWCDLIYGDPPTIFVKNQDMKDAR